MNKINWSILQIISFYNNNAKSEVFIPTHESATFHIFVAVQENGLNSTSVIQIELREYWQELCLYLLCAA